MAFIPSDETKTIGDSTRFDTVPVSEKRFILAHFSDPHIACTDQIKWRDIINKRVLGYLRWKLHRKTEHRNEILASLQKDLQRIKPDHIAITGDLTHLSLPSEFKKVRGWLQSLGTPNQVTVVPGNHDTYVRTDWHQTFACWLDYMVSDPQYQQTDSANGVNDLFPTLRVRGQIALIGVCTAHPNTSYLAIGSIGAFQLKKLETILKQTASQRLFRIILIHHPPISGMVSWRRRLTDAPALRRLVARYGTELILHGHTHKTARNTMNIPAGLTPVMGAPSASSFGRTYDRRARYYIYKIIRSGDGWDVNIAERVYSPNDYRFISGGKQRFYVPAMAG
jgi:3',5'-cyclic AMP phosphodiesterase CpdA